MTSVPAKSISKLSGAVFGMFHKGRKTLIHPHWLDTNRDQYYRTLERIVIPECMDIAADVPGYPQRLQTLLSYTNPAFSDAWNFNVELMYRTVADKAHQTEENITKVYLLRAIMDLVFTMSAVLDDCSDHSEYRMGKESWHTVCPGGLSAAIYDGSLIGYLPFYLLQKHFRADPGYTRMMEVVSMANLKVMIGQTIDVLGQFQSSPSMDKYRKTVLYKTGQFMNAGSALALLHAGITSEELINKTMRVFCKISQLAQIWDDFTDYYCGSTQTGKPSCDLVNGGTSWVSATAMNHFSPSQVKEFKECYGSRDPAKLERVLELYDEIDMPELYVRFMLEQYKECAEQINLLPHPKVQEASFSFLDWLVGHGDVAMSDIPRR